MLLMCAPVAYRLRKAQHNTALSEDAGYDRIVQTMQLLRRAVEDQR